MNGITINKKPLTKRIWEARYIYLLLLPGVIWYIVWCYMPMDGLLLAFKQYRVKDGIWGSPWVGFKNFQRIFITPHAIKAIFNTIEISALRILIEFPTGIILALLLNEVRNAKTKKVLHTIYTFPHFFSWVVVAILMKNIFADNGFINGILASLGYERYGFMADTSFARPFLFITNIWKEVGWNSILYMAVLAGIDPTLYEAAEIDGASRLQQTWYITLAELKPMIILQFILAVGGIMNGSFDQIFNLRNGVTTQILNTIDTYVYDATFNTVPDYGFSAAVGLFKSVIGLILMLTANGICKRVSGSGLIQ